MIKVIGIFIFIFLSFTSIAQQWDQINLPYKATQVRTLEVDTVNDYIYAGGFITYDGSSSGNNNCIWRFDGQNWQVLDTFNNIVTCLKIYQNELYVGGAFQTVNGQNMAHLAKWNGTQWIHVGGSIDGPVGNFEIIDGDLYAMGIFSNIGNNVPANSIAVYDGSSWSDVFNFPSDNSSIFIHGIAKLNGELYVAGNFSITPDEIFDLVKYDGSSWTSVGEGNSIKGALTSISDIVNYNGSIYICGQLELSDGNFGNGIQKWDGSQWHPVGGHIQGENNSSYESVDIARLSVHNNKLYITGGFTYASHVPANGIAVWNDTVWCGNTNVYFDGNPVSIAFHADTMYIAGIDSVNSTYVNKLTRFTGVSQYTDSCSIPYYLGEDEFTEKETLFEVYPNPTNDILNIEYKNTENAAVYAEIYDLSGKVVLRKNLKNNFLNQLFISDLESGVYLLRLTESESVIETKKVVKQ